MRLALFGGTFDPIHCAHLRVAGAAADAFSLDRVLFAPTGRQPLKSTPAEASFDDRLAMVTLALANPCPDTAHPAPDPRLAVTALDAPRPGGRPNFTVDLLEDLARAHPEATLFAIAGADSFLTLAQWRSPGRVLALAEWIVVSRPGLEFSSANASPSDSDFLARPEFAPLTLAPAQRARIHLLPGIHEDISATSLRQHFEAAPASRDAATDSSNTALAQWLPPTVAAYIRDHHLYR